jgi:hypothetical protein
MSTLNEREAALRRALQSAAASIQPAPDGLERIQARLRRPRPVVIAWLEAAWTDIYLRAQDGLQTAVPLLAEGMRRVGQRFAPTSEPGRALPLRWLRPLAAMSLAIFVIAAGTYVGLNGSALISAGNSQNSGKLGTGASSPATGGHRSQAGFGTRISPSGGPHSSPAPSGCTKTTKPHYVQPSSSPSTSPGPSSTGSSPPTGSPSPTPPTTPSPSPSTTPSPANTTSVNGTGTGAAATGAAAAIQPNSALISLAGRATGALPTTTANARRHRTPKSSPSATPKPCASKTTAAIAPSAWPWLPLHGPISRASAQLAAPSLQPTVAALRLNRHPAA